MSELNVKHINKVLDHIRGDLRRLWMPWFGVKKGSLQAEKEDVPDFARCGTACCFAGWSKLLSMPRRKWSGEFGEDGDLRIDVSGELVRLGLTRSDEYLFSAVNGTREQQFQEVRKRLRRIIAARVAAGETSAKKIRV